MTRYDSFEVPSSYSADITFHRPRSQVSVSSACQIRNGDAAYSLSIPSDDAIRLCRFPHGVSRLPIRGIWPEVPDLEYWVNVRVSSVH